MGKKPSHIHECVWKKTTAMDLECLVGQLAMYDKETAFKRTGCTLEELVAAGRVGVVLNIAIPDTRAVSSNMEIEKLQKIAVENGHPALLGAADFQRGVNVVGPAGFGAPNSWNVELIEEAAMRAGEHSAIAGVPLTFSPVADHSFDTKQGRSQEGAATESPLLMSRIVAHMVYGYQHMIFREKDAIVTTVKHVGPYQYTVGPDYTVLPLSERAFLEDCWPPFEAALKAGSRAAMMSFVAFDGVPAHANPYLANLIKQSGDVGVVIVSDFTGINELVEFGVAGNLREAALLAFRDGNLHLDLNGGAYTRELPGLVEDGAITLQALRVRAAEVLQLKYDLGLFDDPFKYCRSAEAAALNEHVPAYVALAEASMVLLKPQQPDPAVLPIPADARVLVVGPLANEPIHWLGEWCANARRHTDAVITPYAGIRDTWRSAVFAESITYDDELIPEEDVARALEHAKHATHVVVCLGEQESWSGESKSRAMPRVPNVQVEFVKQLREATAAKIIVLVTAGRQLAIPPALRHADALIWAPQLGTFAGEAIANVLSGRKNFSGRLAYSLPCHESVTSGFSHREMRIGRPAVAVSAGASEYKAPGWSAFYQELGERASLAGFSFGYGCSHTTFEYSRQMLSATHMSVSQHTSIVAGVTVTNTGAAAGVETVQLYWHDTVSEVVPRRLELLDWQQIELQPNEHARLQFEITPAHLAQFGRDLSEGALPRPDPHPVLLLLAHHAGEAETMLFEPSHPGRLAFTLCE